MATKTLGADQRPSTKPPKDKVPPKNQRLRQDPLNARHHTPENQQMLRQSLQEVGPFRSIGVDGDGIVRAGNATFQEAQRLGLRIRVIDAAPDELIAVRRPDLRGEQAARAGLYDNRVGELSIWDVGNLKQLSDRGLTAGAARAGPPAPAGDLTTKGGLG